jgi:hypothetical protein
LVTCGESSICCFDCKITLCESANPRWWGRAESLEEPLTWEPGPAYEAFHRLLSVPRCRRVMLTGRRQKLAPQAGLYTCRIQL